MAKPDKKWSAKEVKKFKNTKAATQGESIARRAEGKAPNKQSKRGWFSKGPGPKD